MPAIKAVPYARFRDEVLALYQPPCRRPATRAKVAQVLGELTTHCRSTRDLGPATISSWMAATSGTGCLYAPVSVKLASSRLHVWRLPVVHAEPIRVPKARPVAAGRRARRVGAVQADTARLRKLAGYWQGPTRKPGRAPGRPYGYGLLSIAGAIPVRAIARFWGLRTTDVDLAVGVVKIRSHSRRRLKTGARAAVLPMAPPLAEVLAAWIPLTECEWLFPHKWRTGPWLSGTHGKRAARPS